VKTKEEKEAEAEEEEQSEEEEEEEQMEVKLKERQLENHIIHYFLFFLQPEEQLEMLTLYLRRTYFYCIWCGTQYEDDDDLQKECPGSTRNDH